MTLSQLAADLRAGDRQVRQVSPFGDQHEADEDQEGQAQMRRQPVGGDIQHPLLQPRMHHPPADRALRAAQHAQEEQAPGPAGRGRVRG